MSVIIRQAGPEDAETICNLINGLSVYRAGAQDAIPDGEEIRNSLFSEGSTTEVFMCKIDGIAAGYAVITASYSTWLGRTGLYVEDLYFTPDYRGRGAGQAMLKFIAQLAVKRKCGRIEWNALDWDQSAKDFYRSIDALPLNEWIRYRLDGLALEKFAAQDAS